MSVERHPRRLAKYWATAAATVSMLAAIGIAFAATVKTAGKLKLPPHTDVIVICNDPTVLTVLNQDFAAERRTLGNVTDTVTLTVTVNQKVMAPGVSLSEVFPGDPAMVRLLEEAGGNAPPLGDTGDQQLDPYAEAARRQAQGTDDDLTSAFRNEQAFKESMRGNGSSPYDSIPKNQIYDTVIFARANLGSLSGELKVLALIHGGDDAEQAKRIVGEEIANNLLH
ncbi:MAG TPA: hypothetical protein VMA09_23840 [Candidatus Binataceae bacterium]|nr:hypothetical protein [Candidatus Binataceae bacterium]